MPPRKTKKSASAVSVPTAVAKTAKTAKSAISSQSSKRSNAGSGGSTAVSTSIASQQLAASESATESARVVAQATDDNSTLDDNGQIVCSLCCQNVIDGQEEALFCEGKCKQWIHHYCAGVSMPMFQSFSNSSNPFLCTICCQAKWEGEVFSLRATVDTLSEEISSLRSEIELLKNKEFHGTFPTRKMVPVNHRSGDTTVSADGKGESAVCDGGQGIRSESTGNSGRARGGGFHNQMRGQRRGRGGFGNRGGRRGLTSSGRGGCRESVSTSPIIQRERVAVKNARKIWGTLQSTTSLAVKNAIKRVISDSLASNLAVKRKYRANSDGSTTWWFVVRGKQSDVELLETKWECITMQTNWTLEGLFQYTGDSLALKTTLPNSPPVATITIDGDDTTTTENNVGLNDTTICAPVADVSVSVDTVESVDSQTFLEETAEVTL